MLDTRNNFNFWLWPAQALLLAFAISLSSVVIADETETQASVSTEHKALVSQLLNGFHEAAANARFDDYFGRFSAEGHFLGTDAKERWSIPEFKNYAQASFAAGRGWTYKVLERNIESGHIEGVFWFDEILLNKNLGKCRGTGVIVSVDGQLKIAHYSLSMLIPNEIASQVGRQTALIDKALPQ